ncbi:MAG: hypothetical protein ABJC26_18175 [Gemmatimonadaceae bacterium]
MRRLWVPSVALAGGVAAMLAASSPPQRTAKRLVSLWGACIIALLLTEDFAAGFARDGLGGRVFVTSVVAGILAALALRVPKYVTPAVE